MHLIILMYVYKLLYNYYTRTYINCTYYLKYFLPIFTTKYICNGSENDNINFVINNNKNVLFNLTIKIFFCNFAQIYTIIIICLLWH